jgi:HEAT repeat protein
MDTQRIESLLEQAESDDPGLQVEAIYELFDSEAEIPIPTLIRLLTSPHWGVRSSAADVLGYLGSQQLEIVGPALVNLLNDEESAVRCEAVDSLAQLKYAPAGERFTQILIDDPDSLMRASAAEGLGKLGNPQASLVLSRALGDDAALVRAFAARSIGLLGDTQLLSKLRDVSETEEEVIVRADLFGARYRLGEQIALQGLLELLEISTDEESDISERASIYRMINQLRELVDQTLPAMPAEDSRSVRVALESLVSRFPGLLWLIEDILERLSTFE